MSWPDQQSISSSLRFILYIKQNQTKFMLFLFWYLSAKYCQKYILSTCNRRCFKTFCKLITSKNLTTVQWGSFSVTHTHTPPWSVHCAHRCVSSPRCWSPWRLPRCCWTQEPRGSGGSSGCSRWWPRSRTWGCTWSPSPETGGSPCAWRESHRNHEWARTETSELLWAKRPKEFIIFTTDAGQMY